MAFPLTSSAFNAGQVIPRKYTGEGADVSPALTWSGAPQGVVEFALICDDPDAPTPQPWVHWVIYGLHGGLTGLDEGIPQQATLDKLAGARQGPNSWTSNNTGYRGPMPPPGHGVHHYYFRLYALDTKLTLGPGATKEQVLAGIKGHVLGEAELLGTYERK